VANLLPYRVTAVQFETKHKEFTEGLCVRGGKNTSLNDVSFFHQIDDAYVPALTTNQADDPHWLKVLESLGK